MKDFLETIAGAVLFILLQIVGFLIPVAFIGFGLKLLGFI